MRKVIAVEGVIEQHRQMIIEPGAITMEAESIPGVWSYDFHNPDSVIAKARDLQRNEETGEISVDIEWLDVDKADMAKLLIENEDAHEDNWRYFLTNCSSTVNGDGVQVVTRATLKAVAFLSNGQTIPFTKRES